MLLAEISELLDLRMDEANAPWFINEEKERFLNQAQDDIVRQTYKVFEIDEYARQILAPLVQPIPVTLVQTANRGEVDLDGLTILNSAQGSRLMFVVGLIVDVTDSCGKQKKRVARPVQIDDLVGLTNDPLNKPTAREPYFIIDATATGTRQLTLYVAGDNDTQIPIIGTANTLRVLRSPRDVSFTGPVECELPDLIHDRLVERTVTLMLENVEAGRLTTHTLTSKIDEQ